ncbi:3D domain-containing protein [Alkalibacillus salilacus]|uniref:3D (Asp-Asp-Asp) domain-containing protein/LysM repeat protein n=1 Tax=Alkalibacillus salilacus TaxID=284582 RepID=A0ABT9VBQ7_9BACI|nr:3D domain-containing protein [Alkalibacillus salilacus]MDQ0158344.1 3D (Asp-Asp-Asp) domain-containing protein/LysM repeat protein [Alkalibacillus salilacus]
MKKLVASIATGVIIAGATATTASAADYEVEDGDTLWGIAEENNTTVEELVDINDLDTKTIYSNQTLTLDEAYTVEEGDTLFAISEEHDVSVSELKQWNELNSDLIMVGQELDLNGANVEQSTNESTSASADSSSNESSQSEESAEQDTSDDVQQTSSNNNESSSEEQPSSQNDPEGRTITVSATAYTADCAGCSGVTATGVDLNANPNKKVIAVDPDVIPLGTKVHVEGYGTAIAADTGGAINGNKIDVHVPTKDEAYDWGTRTVDVTIVE